MRVDKFTRQVSTAGKELLPKLITPERQRLNLQIQGELKSLLQQSQGLKNLKINQMIKGFRGLLPDVQILTFAEDKTPFMSLGGAIHADEEYTLNHLLLSEEPKEIELIELDVHTIAFRPLPWWGSLISKMTNYLMFIHEAGHIKQYQHDYEHKDANNKPRDRYIEAVIELENAWNLLQANVQFQGLTSKEIKANSSYVKSEHLPAIRKYMKKNTITPLGLMS